MSISLYFHTLRHLRAKQLVGRIWFRLYRPRPDTRPAPPRRALRYDPVSPCSRRARFVPPHTFTLLNDTREVTDASGWNAEGVPKLWLYNLHYFDDLRRADATRFRADHARLVERWIAENPPGVGNGWEPYPLSLRIVNWIRWFQAGAEPKPAWLDNLAAQVRYLSRRVEHHLLGNHLFANLKALVFAGCFFAGPEAEGWLARALPLVRRELSEQVLGDGAHFELSPMYHALILEDLLDLIAIGEAFGPSSVAAHVPAWRATASRMQGWLDSVVHPDGRIPFFNDSAFGIAPEPSDLSAYATCLGIAANEASREDRPSGYFRLARGPAAVLFDAARVGPDYLPGHAHADTLSFELSWGAQRVICNSGCSRYGTDEVRQWERSTAAHATVEIDGEDSSEVWGGFRVARRAYPRGLLFGGDRIACAHDGYRRLSGQPVHRRELRVASDGTVSWIDTVTGQGEHRLIGRIPLHPDIVPSPDGSSAFELRLPDGTCLRLERTDGGPLRLRTGRWCPEFGIERARHVVSWEHTGALPYRTELQLRSC